MSDDKIKAAARPGWGPRVTPHSPAKLRELAAQLVAVADAMDPEATPARARVDFRLSDGAHEWTEAGWSEQGVREWLAKSPGATAFRETWRVSERVAVIAVTPDTAGEPRCVWTVDGHVHMACATTDEVLRSNAAPLAEQWRMPPSRFVREALCERCGRGLRSN